MAGGALVVEEFCSALQCGVGALWGKRVGMGWGVCVCVYSLFFTYYLFERHNDTGMHVR